MKSRPSPASSTTSTFHRTALAAALSGLFALPATPALAGTLTVVGGGCTLIDAINGANAGVAIGTCTGGTPYADTIVLPASSTQALSAVNNITYGANGLPSITSAITIQGNGSTITRQAGSPEFRLFHVAATGDLSLQQTTVSGGFAMNGGGILNHGTVSLTNSTLSGNTAFAAGTTAGDRGGGIHNVGYFGATIVPRATLTNSTVSGNTSSGDGGGIYSNNAEVTLTKSTVSGNTANIGGGLSLYNCGLQLDDSTLSGNQGYAGAGLYVTSSTVGIHNSTISGNTAFAQAAGIFMSDSTIAIERSLVSGNVSSNNFYAEIFSNYNNTLTLSRNLFGHSGETSSESFYGFSPGATDINATSDGNTGILMPTALTSIRGALADNGGPTLTRALVAGSPALDAVPASDPGCTGTDQRGITRPQGTACDIGSVEGVGAPVSGGTITVVGGGCTLIDAINSANAGGNFGTCTGGTPYADTIVLPANSTQALSAVNNITDGPNGLPSITSAITIQGNGSTITRQAGSPEFRIFRIATEGDLSLQQTTISGGRAMNGGGILNHGTVTLTNSVLSGNTAFAAGTTAGDRGGGIHNVGYFGAAIVPRATLTNSTVSGNTSSGDGGGIYSRNTQLTLTKSTVSGNTANIGGGLSLYNCGLQLDDSTLSGNQGYAGAGLYVTSSTVGIHNSTISGNTAFAQAAGIFMSDSTIAIERSLVSGNVSSNNFYAEIFSNYNNTFTLSRNLFGHSGETSSQSFYGFSPGATDINATSDGNTGILMPTALTSIRGPLANNGGLTLTHALVTGSPALDAVPTSDPGCTGTDQRGTARPQGTSCDIGAFERVPPVVAAAGTCGTADGVATSSAPAMNLCGVGTLTATVMGSAGAWRWTCDGTNGGSVSPSCSAPYASQTITLSALPTSITVGGTTSTVTATNSSGLPATLSSTTTAACTLGASSGSGAMVTATATGVAAGTCTVKANHPGVDTGPSRFLPAAQQTVNITVNPAPADTTPNAFTFMDQTNVPRNSVRTSNAVAIGGITGPAAISIMGGGYSIGCTGTFTTAAGSISNGQTVCVRHTSSASFNSGVNTILTVGGVSDTFTTVTAANGVVAVLGVTSTVISGAVGTVLGFLGGL